MALTKQQIQILNPHAPGKAVATALSELLEKDRVLFEADANERSITFRFGHYLQQCLPDWTVDCEYNRTVKDPKRLRPLAGC